MLYFLHFSGLVCYARLLSVGRLVCFARLILFLGNRNAGVILVNRKPMRRVTLNE